MQVRFYREDSDGHWVTEHDVHFDNAYSKAELNDIINLTLSAIAEMFGLDCGEINYIIL